MKNQLFSNDVAVTNLCLLCIIVGMIVFIGLRYFKESRSLSHEEDKRLKIIAVSALAVYLVIIFYATLACRKPYDSYRSTKPFATFINAYWGVKAARYDVIQNLLFFMPFGFLLEFLSEKRFRWYIAIPIMCLYSAGIETVQYITKLGVSQVDDVICNTISGTTGYILASGFTAFIRKALDNNDV